jgi:phosphoribosyl-dephospho-CoA transferase
MRKLRRHDLVFVSPGAWRSLVNDRADLAGEPLVAGWADRGWPLIARRALAGEADGLALGLPLPPSLGKRRLSVLLQPDDVIATAPPPLLSAAIDVAPPTWRRTLERLVELAARHGVEARVFGSLAWHLLTALDYLTARSDLDILLSFARAGDLARLAADLATIEAAAPMRLDGELVRDDGAGVNWREIHARVSEVLVKTIGGIALLDGNRFLSGEFQ